MLYYIVLYYIVLYFIGYHHPPQFDPPDPGSLPSITKDFGSRMWAPRDDWICPRKHDW